MTGQTRGRTSGETTPATAPEAMAVHWFNRQRSSDMSAEEERDFALWLERDPANRIQYRRVERAWAAVGEVEDHPALLDVRERVERRAEQGARLRMLAMMAAGFGALAAGGAALSHVGALAQFAWFAPAPVQEYRTLIGERTTLTLADGSLVTLDTNTILRAQLSHWQRRVTLERGQASFQVAKDRSRPFIVTAAGMSVRATGTAFDVRAEPGRFEVTLIEGRVRVQEQGREGEDAPMANMRPGWRLSVGDDARWRMEPVDLIKETSWHNGVLTFFEDPLARAADEMNRYSQRKLVFRGDAPATFIMGNFRAGDVEGFAEAAEMNKVARVVGENEDQIELAAW